MEEKINFFQSTILGGIIYCLIYFHIISIRLCLILVLFTMCVG